MRYEEQLPLTVEIANLEFVNLAIFSNSSTSFPAEYKLESIHLIKYFSLPKIGYEEELVFP